MMCESLRLPRSKPARIGLEPKRGARAVWAWNLAGENYRLSYGGVIGRRSAAVSLRLQGW
jgi:hypothetical protein